MKILHRLGQRLKHRPDSEHEMSFNRFGIAVVFIVVVLLEGQSFTEPPLIVMSVYIFLSAGLLAHIVAFPAANPARRFIALVIDTGCMSVQTYLGGEQVAGFFLVFLWIAFGNGLRFGLQALRAAVVVTGTGAAITLLTTPYWKSMPALGFGLWCSLVILPAYTGSLIQRLAKARQEAEEASAAKTLFLANVSHELRTPLTAIIGMNRILQDTSLDREQREMTETVHVASQSLLALIDDLLRLSRIDAGRELVSPAKFDVTQMLLQVRQYLLAQAEAKGLVISVYLDPRVPAEIVSGERQVREILTNLVGNAVKFTDAGRVLVSVAVVDDLNGNRSVSYAVSDTGIGIAANAKAHIFDTFTQADSTIAERFGGTGLGLSISRRLAEALGGTLGVESAVGRGSTFKLCIPLSIPAGPTPKLPPDMAVCVVAAQHSHRPWVADDLSTLVGSITEIDATLPIDRLTGALGVWYEAARLKALPVIMLAADGLGWPPAQLQAVLVQCRSVAGQNLLLAGAVGLPTNVDPRWHCATMLTGPSDRTTLSNALRVASMQVQAVQPEPLSATGRCLRLLVAEDNSVNQKVLMKLLEKAGHDAELVQDGEAALDVLDAGAGHFDAVLMDVNMPHMDGLEATRIFRFTTLGERYVPIIGLTADATEEMAVRCRQAGMDACLTKPFDAVTLLATVQELVNGNEHLSLAAKRPQTNPSRHLPSDKSVSTKSQPEKKVLDDGVLRGLVELGGEAFVSELVVEFRQEAGRLVVELAAALRQNRTVQILGHAHSLRGLSFNIGACMLGYLCEEVEQLSDTDLALKGHVLAQRANTELARVNAAIEARNINH